MFTYTNGAQNSISSFVYIQPALIAPPALPRIFDDDREDTLSVDADSYDVMLDAQCSVSNSLYEIMCYNLHSRDQLGTDDDIAARLSHYQKLLDWQTPRRAPRSRGLNGLCQSLFIEFVPTMHTIIGSLTDTALQIIPLGRGHRTVPASGTP
jgi:hypothetical protein